MSEDSDESVLREWLSVLNRQKWIVLLAVIAVPLVAFAASQSQQRRYQASATVLVNEQNPTAAALNLSNGATSPPDRYAATQAQLARVGTVAELAVKAANVPDRTGAALLENSSVRANPAADLLTFSVTDHIPAIAVRLADSYAKQFSAYRRVLDTAALRGALADARRKLKALAASGRRGSPLFRRLAASERKLDELQTVQAGGSSAAVVGRASRAPQVQPKTERNIILGVIVGLALGIAAAFLREALDTRVRAADELRRRLGLPLLGHIPKPDRRLTRRQQLAALSEPTASSTEAYRILKNNLENAQLQRDIGSIVITSTARAEGKSTTAANLAVIFARSGRHVILLDFDLRHPSIDQLFGLRDRPVLTHVAAGVRLTDALTMVDLDADGRTAGSLEVLTVGWPPPDPGESEFLLSSFVTDGWAALAERCDLLLIDTPPVLGVGDAMTIATRSDALILVTRLNHVRRATLAEARRVLEACPIPKLGVIATGGRTTQAGHLQRLRSASTSPWPRFPRLHLRGADGRRRSKEVDGIPTYDFFAEPDETRGREETRGGPDAVTSGNRRGRRGRDD